MIRRPPRSTQSRSSAASDVYKRQLERRLQTIVFRKGLTRTIFQARQLITHGHVTIDNRRVTIPGYIVPKAEEAQITYSAQSAVANQAHPLRVGLTLSLIHISEPTRLGMISYA